MFYYIVQGGFLGLAILAGGLNLWWIAVLIWPATVLFLMSRNRGAVSATQTR
jgi:lactate permease